MYARPAIFIQMQTLESLHVCYEYLSRTTSHTRLGNKSIMKKDRTMVMVIRRKMNNFDTAKAGHYRSPGVAGTGRGILMFSLNIPIHTHD